MKSKWNANQVTFLILILVPMIIFISYFYLDKQKTYELQVKQYEKNMANILLMEEEFIKSRLESEPLYLKQDVEKIKEEFIHSHPEGVENLLLKLAMDRLNCSGFGIYSSSRAELVFQLGKEGVFEQIDINKVKSSLTTKQKNLFEKYDDSYVYIVPIEGGFIYTFQEDITSKPNPDLFIGMLILAIILAIFSAKWVENRTQKRIDSLNKELVKLKESGDPLPLYDDNFNKIVHSVNDLKNYLSSQKDLLHTILDTLPIGIIYYDKDGDVVYVNKTTETLTGYTKEDIQSFTISTNILDNNNNVFWETLRSGQSFLRFESYCPTKDKNEIPVMTSTKPLYDYEHKLIGTISSFFDISEQERLKKIEQRAKVMLDHISDGIMMVDNDGVITGFNHGAEEMTGLKAKEVIGKKYDDIFIKRKTIFTKLTQTLETKMEYTNYKKETTTEDGRKVYLMITTKILWDNQGQQIGALGIYKDITHLEELSQQIQRADKLAMVGELAAGTAHEIRNPLTTIKGFIQLFKYELQNSNIEQYIDLILNEINHINEIIREMLLLAKPANPSKEFGSINQMVRDIVTFMHPETMLHNINIRMELEEGIPEIEIDERLIKQVFINLIRNAIQAMENSGEIAIYSKYNKTSNMIEVTFEDSGIGIPEDKLAKIYEPFYTTKEEGTGLGIPVSYRIMKNHNGDLHVYSTVGKGTKVILYFPLIMDDM